MPGIVFAPDAYAYRSPFGDGAAATEANLAYLDYLIEQEGGNNKVAAMLVETVVGSNGIIPPPDGYLPGLRALCDRWGILLIVDETMTGMGRTGRMFAFEHYGIEPDIIVLGKALGVYCPMAATIFSAKVARTFDDHIFGHGQSFSGHALGAAAALASIDVLHDDGLLARTRELGDYLGERLRALAARHACVGDVRGLGLFWTVELVRDRATKEPLRRATEKYERTIVKDVSDYLFRERDIYVPSDKFGIWVVPPLVVTRDELDWVCAAIDDALGSPTACWPKAAPRRVGARARLAPRRIPRLAARRDRRTRIPPLARAPARRELRVPDDRRAQPHHDADRARDGRVPVDTRGIRRARRDRAGRRALCSSRGGDSTGALRAEYLAEQASAAGARCTAGSR